MNNSLFHTHTLRILTQDLLLLPMKATEMLMLTNLLARIPDHWKLLLQSELLTDPTAPDFNKEGIQLGTEMVNLSLPNRELYKAIAKRRFPQDDLLAKVKAECIQDGTDIEGLSPKTIWASLSHTKLDYPKLTDPLWRLYHGKLRTGYSWIEIKNCDICGTVQSRRHLF